MARPTKLRKIRNVPMMNVYKPSGIKLEDLQIIELKFEELEAMRLKDVENLNQEECANIMKVSRQTFQLIIDEARSKVANALNKGFAISISGGNYTLNICEYRCKVCGHVFEAAYESENNACPKCMSNQVECAFNDEEFCSENCSKDCKRK
jgi:predicted DNA-binding protein (UPF0251 family)